MKAWVTVCVCALSLWNDPVENQRPCYKSVLPVLGHYCTSVQVTAAVIQGWLGPTVAGWNTNRLVIRDSFLVSAHLYELNLHNLNRLQEIIMDKILIATRVGGAWRTSAINYFVKNWWENCTVWQLQYVFHCFKCTSELVDVAQSFETVCVKLQKITRIWSLDGINSTANLVYIQYCKKNSINSIKQKKIFHVPQCWIWLMSKWGVAGSNASRG